MRYVCDWCGAQFPRTYEFGDAGKHERWGEYARQLSIRNAARRRVAYADIERVYAAMRGDASDYSLINFNCGHWAAAFYARLLRLPEQRCPTIVLSKSGERNYSKKQESSLH